MTIPEPIRRWLLLAGMDRAVAFTVLGRVVAVLSGPLTIVLQLRYLSGEEQGYIFAFEGVLGVVAFLELGIGQAIGVFTGHEMAVLAWQPDGALAGPPSALARLRSLIRLGVIWYALIAAAGIALILPFGLWYFRVDAPPDAVDPSAAIAWRVSWTLCVIASAGAILVGPLLAVLEGVGMVSELAIMRLKQNVFGNIASWSILLFGGRLLAAPALSGVMLLVSVVHIWGWRRRLRAIAAGHPDGGNVPYWAEIWPLQWRIGLSFLSGYFAIYLINPILFKVCGPRLLGQFGQCVRVANSLQNLSLSWVSTQGPKFSGMIALRDWARLDRVFLHRLAVCLTVMALGCVSAWGVVWAMYAWDFDYAERFLPPFAFAVVLLNGLAVTLIGALAIYLRAHKTDPFYLFSLAQGLLLPLLVYLFGRQFGVEGVAVASLATTLLLLVFAIKAFRHARLAHYSEAESCN